MSRRRQTIARRLVEAQRTAAMLTTFNEVDMSAVLDLRRRFKESFRAQHEVGLGIVSFFLKASVVALKAYPRLNAEIQGDEMVLKHYFDIGVAVGASGGLVVPVLRDADRLSFAAIERGIKGFARKAEDGSLSMEDLRGGTFTITNGGVFGSLLSTPILNPAAGRDPRTPHDPGARRARRERRGDSTDDVRRAELRPPARRRAGGRPVPRTDQGDRGGPGRPPARGVTNGQSFFGTPSAASLATTSAPADPAETSLSMSRILPSGPM